MIRKHNSGRFFFSTTLVSYSPSRGHINLLSVIHRSATGVRKDNVAHRIELMRFK